MPAGSPEPTKGVRSLGQEDLDAYAAGRATLDELATKAGVSKQAVSRAMKRRGIHRRVVVQITPQKPVGQVAAGPVPLPPERLQDHVVALARAAVVGVLAKLHAASSSPDALGPSALKSLAAGLVAILDEARRLEILEESGDVDQLPELVVRVMSAADAEALRSRIEAGNLDTDHDPDDALDADDHAARQDVDADATSSAGNGCTPPPTPAPAPAEIHDDQSARLQRRIEAITRQHGARCLRLACVALGLPPAVSPGALATTLLAHAAEGVDQRRAVDAELDRLDVR